jgi:hypothetical protein
MHKKMEPLGYQLYLLLCALLHKVFKSTNSAKAPPHLTRRAKSKGIVTRVK